MISHVQKDTEYVWNRVMSPIKIRMKYHITSISHCVLYDEIDFKGKTTLKPSGKSQSVLTLGMKIFILWIIQRKENSASKNKDW